MLSHAETRVLYFLCRPHAVAECAACGKGWKPIELADDLIVTVSAAQAVPAT